MRNIVFNMILFTGLLSGSFVSNGQFLKEPKYIGNVYYVPATNAPPIKLERQLTRYTRKFLLFEGASSSVSIDSTETIKLIVKVLNNQLDPINAIRLYKIHNSEKKDYRYMFLRNDNPLKIKFIDYDKIERINFESDPFGKSSYLIYLKNLTPGEYVIAVDNDKYGWNLFGVK